jgi:hypothetical protein
MNYREALIHEEDISFGRATLFGINSVLMQKIIHPLPAKLKEK